MINVSLETLLQFLKKNKYEADVQKETQQIYTILKFNQREYPLFLRIFDESQLLQILVFIPSHLEPNQGFELKKSDGEAIKTVESTKTKEQETLLSDLARLLHLLNKELDIPGFGMDEMAGAVFYRLMLPTPKKKVDSALLLAYLKSAEQVCQLFSPPIEALTSGHLTLKEMIQKAQKMDNE